MNPELLVNKENIKIWGKSESLVGMNFKKVLGKFVSTKDIDTLFFLSTEGGCPDNCVAFGR